MATHGVAMPQFVDQDHQHEAHRERDAHAPGIDRHADQHGAAGQQDLGERQGLQADQQELELAQREHGQRSDREPRAARLLGRRRVGFPLWLGAYGSESVFAELGVIGHQSRF